MLQRTLVCLILGIVFIFTSCKREEDPPKVLGDFDEIRCNGGVNIKLVPGTTNEVISTTLEDSEYNTGSHTLNINASGGYITIAVNDINLLWCNGSHVTSEGTVTLEDLRFFTNATDITMNDVHVLDTLYGDFTNTGTYHFGGTASFVHVIISNTGRFEGFDLIADSVQITAGAYDCEVYAALKLTACNSSTGDIFYRGNPPIVDSCGIGSGFVIPD